MKLLIISILFCFGVGACAVANQASNNVNEASKDEITEVPSRGTSPSNRSIFQENEAQKTPFPQNIRTIDFKNFTYNWFPKYGEVIIKRKIVLRNGANDPVHIEGPGIHPLGEDYEEFLGNVSYADLTGDSKEEAVVTVGVEFYRWTPKCIFVFAEEDNRPVLLWQYETSAYGKNLDWRGHKIIDGKLVIEEYDTAYGNPAICCPLRYFRKSFAWNGKIFEEKEVEIIPFNHQGREFTGYPSDANE